MEALQGQIIFSPMAVGICHPRPPARDNVQSIKGKFTGKIDFRNSAPRLGARERHDGYFCKLRSKLNEGSFSIRQPARPLCIARSISASDDSFQSQGSPIPSLPGSSSRLGRAMDAMLEPVVARLPSKPDPSLINDDFSPTLESQRLLSAWDMASLWIGLVVAVPTWYLAGSLVDLGMAWWQGVATVFAANCLVLLPMVLNGHPGCKYGVPFPVLARASYGVRGANVPSLLRALVACGWFGIQTWVGGQSIYQLADALTAGALQGGAAAAAVPLLGISLAEFACFLAFWAAQRAQLTGQAVGLPLFMAAFTFVGLAVTSATVAIFGRSISDPIALLGQIKGFLPVVLSLAGLCLATLTTNIAANVVAPANAFVNLSPALFSFRTGGLVTAVLGILLQPWRLITSTQGFIFTWLIGYSALLGPVGGVIIVDYFLLRGRTLDVDALYSTDPASRYWYAGGYNTAALLATVVGIAPNVPGLAHALGLARQVAPAWVHVYNSAWQVGFLVAGLVYWALMQPVLRRQGLAMAPSPS
eukprot:jgi/Mesen1/1867/ME000143S00920